jgi:hypothetical protein
MKTYGGSGCILVDPNILDLGTSLRRVVSFTPNYYHKVQYLWWRDDGIVTSYGLDGRGVGVRPSFFFHPRRSDRLWGSVCSHLLTLVPRSRIFQPWRWRRYVPPKRLFTQDLHRATYQKTAFLIITAVKLSNLTYLCRIYKSPLTVSPAHPLLTLFISTISTLSSQSRVRSKQACIIVRVDYNIFQGVPLNSAPQLVPTWNIFGVTAAYKHRPVS